MVDIAERQIIQLQGNRFPVDKHELSASKTQLDNSNQVNKYHSPSFSHQHNKIYQDR